MARDAGRQAALRHRAADGAPLVFAGLWEGWRSPTGEVLRTFAILTTVANGIMSSLHGRMPVIVEEEDWATWLGETDVDPLDLMRPAAEDVLHLWAVSRAVNNVRNDTPELLDRLDDPHALPSSNAPSGVNPA